MTRAPAVVLATTVALAAFSCTTPSSPSSSSSSSSSSGSTTSTLTPARQLAGTWRTSAPVTFFYQTDFCGTRQTVAQALWNVTWVMTATAGFTNVLDVDMRVSSGTSAAIGRCNPSGYVPFVSPTSFQVVLSSSSMTQASGTRNGIQLNGNFTTDLMQITWNHYECLIYCFGEFTDTLALKMVRQ